MAMENEGLKRSSFLYIERESGCFYIISIFIANMVFYSVKNLLL